MTVSRPQDHNSSLLSSLIKRSRQSEVLPEQGKPTPPLAPAHPASQFSLSGVLLVIGLFAILLGPVVWLRVPWFAGFLGAGSLVVLATISIFNDRQQVVQVGWWVLAALYASALIVLYIHS